MTNSESTHMIHLQGDGIALWATFRAIEVLMHGIIEPDNPARVAEDCEAVRALARAAGQQADALVQAFDPVVFERAASGRPLRDTGPVAA